MKKTVLLLLSIPLYITCFAQAFSNTSKYPFDMVKLNALSYYMMQNDTLIPVYQEGKYHYINTYTKNITSEAFDEAYPFNLNYAVVKKDGKYGVVDRMLKYKVTPRFESMYPESAERVGFRYPQLRFEFYSGKLSNEYHEEGEPVFPGTHMYKSGRKYGLVYEGGKKSPPVFDSILSIHMELIIAKKAGKFGAVNAEGKVVLPFKFTDYFGQGFANYALKQGTDWHYYIELKELFKCKFKPVLLNSNVLMFEDEGLYNYFDYSGKKMLNRNYKWISASGYIAVNQENDIVLFNKKRDEFVYFTESK